MSLNVYEVQAGLDGFLKEYPRPRVFSVPGGAVEAFYENINARAGALAESAFVPEDITAALVKEYSVSYYDDVK